MPIYCRVPTVKAVITTGEGKFYSNGLDVEYLLSLDPEKRLDLLSDSQKLMRRVLTFPAVTVAAMNGKTFENVHIILYVNVFYCVDHNKATIHV